MTLLWCWTHCSIFLDVIFLFSFYISNQVDDSTLALHIGERRVRGGADLIDEAQLLDNRGLNDDINDLGFYLY